jgi:acetyl-CoA C-acetyltransferase
LELIRMRQVAIIGIGQTPVSEHWEKSLREIAGEAVFAAMQDAQFDYIEGLFIGNMLSGILSKQENLGPLIADWTGLKNIEAMKVEAACGSGAAALRMALMAVSSGELDSAIALGVEKMSETKGTETTSALATAADADYEIINGLSFVAINALVMQRYMYEYHWEHTDFGPFSINAHSNAVNNPYARLREVITINAYAHARMISHPINLLDASPIGDGAAALIILPADQARLHNRLNRPLITIDGSATATDTLAVHDRKNPLWLRAAEKSSKRAYSQAGVSPSDIDVFELHDAFSIMAALSLEASGFADPGSAPRLGLNGAITPSGKIPISTRGGLKARGHPVGATGIYQILEVILQLRGEAGETQVENARIGMAQNIGGSGATIITHILKAS